MSYRYRLFGLHICSNRPLSASVDENSATAADLNVVFAGPLTATRSSPGKPAFTSDGRDAHDLPALEVWHSEGGYRWKYADGVEFEIDRTGTRVTVLRPPQYSVEYAATYLLGPVIAFILRLRGVVTLHASAVVVGSAAVALLGSPGAGKSTTAAAVAALGFSVLSDDVVALEERSQTFFVRPGYPHLRLWPDAARLLYGTCALPLISEGWDKRDLALNGNFCDMPARLQGAYLLERADAAGACAIKAVHTGSALVSLVANTYVWYALDEAMRAHEFQVLTRLAQQIPLWRVQAGVAGPEQIAKMVLGHATQHEFTTPELAHV